MSVHGHIHINNLTEAPKQFSEVVLIYVLGESLNHNLKPVSNNFVRSTRQRIAEPAKKGECGFHTFVLFTSGLGLRDMLLVALRPPFRSYEGERERRGDIDRRCKGGGERELSRRGERERMGSRSRDKERRGIAG